MLQVRRKGGEAKKLFSPFYSAKKMIFSTNSIEDRREIRRAPALAVQQ
jgi:hypothetical protein